MLMKGKIFFVVIFILALITFISLSKNSKPNDNQYVSNNSIIAQKVETTVFEKGRYEAAQTAYNDVLQKYNKLKDVYDCIQFYKNIGADASKNDEYREALNSYPNLKSAYDAALAAYNEVFPEFAHD